MLLGINVIAPVRIRTIDAYQVDNFLVHRECMNAVPIGPAAAKRHDDAAVDRGAVLDLDSKKRVVPVRYKVERRVLRDRNEDAPALHPEISHGSKRPEIPFALRVMVSHRTRG